MPKNRFPILAVGLTGLRFARRASYAALFVTRAMFCIAWFGLAAGYWYARYAGRRFSSWLAGNNRPYRSWLGWQHRPLMLNSLGVTAVGLVGLRLFMLLPLFAFDQSDNWDFSNGGDYILDSGVEVASNQARLAAQEYSSDASTAALYHLNELGGTTVTDSSANGNTGSATDPAWGSGNMNNALTLDGATTRVEAPDSGSLSLTGDNTLEGWFKLDSALSAGSHGQRQGLVDKGDYQLYLDNETGKLTYELANSNPGAWTQQAGNDINSSWDLNGNPNIESSVTVGTDLYVGTGNGTGDAEVWRWDGTTWTQVGGDGINNCWAINTFESVLSMATDGTNVYASLGNSAGDAEVWMFNGTTWSKIGGDAVNSSWVVNTYEAAYTLNYFGGNLYAGLGASTGDAEVWRFNGTTWTKIGGDGINSGWGAGYEAVYSQTNDGTNLYAGLGSGAGDAEVWRWNGTAWTKIGGDTVNSGWASVHEYVLSLSYFNSTLYAGLGTTADDGEVWSFNGTAWTQIGGDSLNSGWTTGYEGAYKLTNDGTNLYAGLGATLGDNEVWSWNGSAWTKIGGDTINSGWTNTHTIVNSMVMYSGQLVIGMNTSSTTVSGQVWVWNGASWTLIGGDYVNFSWGFRGLQSAEVMTVSGDYLYAGTGVTTAGNAMVWRFDGSTWTLMGGQGVNGSWPANTYEAVTSMVSYGGSLIVGLGVSASDAEVWRLSGSTWTKIGGDSLNGGWAAGLEEVDAMAVVGNTLYAGLGNSNLDSDVWSWNGLTWTQVGGDGLNSGWNSGYNRIASMAVYDGNLVAGLGSGAADAEVWQFSGGAWSKFGGDAVNSSWDAVNYEEANSMIVYNGTLVVGLGVSTDDAEVWQWDGTNWTKFGGDDLNSGWTGGTYERIRTLVVYNGKLYAGLGNGTGDGEVWQWDGTSWLQTGGDLIDSSWASTVEEVRSFSVYQGKLYSGTGNTANVDAMVWSYGNNGYLQSAADSFTTDWIHAAGTYDGSTMRLYIDGTLDASQSVALTLPDSSSPLVLGSTHAGREAGKALGYLDGQLDEVRISSIARSGFNSLAYSNQARGVTLSSAVRQSGVWYWEDFEVNETPSGGSIAYRLSDDNGSTWKYWSGVAWVESAGYNEANTLAEVDSNIITFPVTFNGIKWQAVLSGDGTQQVTLADVTLNSTSDTTAPSLNASSIQAFKANGGSALALNDWTNGQSPYFTWTSGSDSESGIKGYCLYLGQDSLADPVVTKGLLGTSPVATGGNCQFMVAGSSVDFATAGYIATALSSSTSPYYLIIKAMDNAGNIYAGSGESFNFRFDDTPPTNPGFITAPSGFVNSKDVTLTWPTVGGSAAADGHSGFVGLQYKIGNNTWYGDTHTGTQDISDLLTEDGSYTMQDPVDYDNLFDGINTVYFRTWDNAGNVTTTYVTATIKLNTSGAPSEPLNLQALPATNTVNSFAFDWDTPTTYVGDANNITYCYTINTLPSSGTCTFTSAGVTALGAGPYATQPGDNTFYVVARDESSNINYTQYASVIFTANTSAPGIPLNTDIVDVSIKSTSNWRLAITWDEPSSVGSGVASYRVHRSTDNVTFNFIGSSSSTTYIDAGLSQIEYFYKVQACDSANNCGSFGSTVSETPTGKFTEPAALVSGPSVSAISTRKATISWSTDRDSDSKVAIGTASGTYGSTEVGSSAQVTAHKIELENLSPGTTYYFVTKWTDEDGNTGTSPEVTFKTQPAPTVKDVNVDKITIASAQVAFTSELASGVKLYYGQSESFGGVVTINTSAEESTYTVVLDELGDGTKYFFKINPIDGDGIEYDGTVLGFTTLARPKITNLRFQPIESEPSSTQRITWDTNVETTSLVRYGVIGETKADVFDSELVTAHEVIIRNLQDDSEYELIVESRDKDGNVATSDVQRFHTDLDTRPPKVSDVLIESSIRGSGSEARGQIVVSWQTDEPSASRVAYGQGAGGTNYSNTTASDGELTTEHVVIVSDLPTSTVYHLKVLSADKAGNEGEGEDQSVIIGRPSDSILSIILNSLQRIFGF